MPTQYTADGKTAVPPCAAPGQTNGPTTQLPVDADARNADSTYPAWQAHAQFITKLQKAVPSWYATGYQAAQTGAPGYSAVRHTGVGAGTVIPAATAPLAGFPTVPVATPELALHWVIWITTPGAVGTAAFKTSIDGGETWSGPTTTSAELFDPMNTVILAFSGTFALNDLYSFEGNMADRLAYFDGTYNLERGGVDHNGLPRKYHIEIVQDWVAFNAAGSTSPVAIGSSLPLAFGASWVISGTASVGTYLSLPASSGFGGNGMMLTGSGTSGNKTYLRTVGAIHKGASVLTLRGYLGIPAGATHATFMFGLFDNFTTMSSSTNFIGLQMAGASQTTWQLVGTNDTPIDTGITPSAGADHIEIQYHSANTVMGDNPNYMTAKNIVFVWINGVLRGISTGGANLTNVVGLGFGIEATATATAGALYMSPITCVIEGRGTLTL